MHLFYYIEMGLQNAKKCCKIDQMHEKIPQNQENKEEEKMTRGQKIWEVIKVFALPIVIVLSVRLYVAQPFIVKGASMEPNFEDKEYLIIDEATPLLKELPRGTVVVFRYPLEPTEFFIKRIVGLPGEHITIKGGEITLRANDSQEILLKEAYLARGTVTIGDIDMDIPSDNYFVLGDNRNFSSDSRRWGLVPKKLLTGRAFVRLWPPEKIGILQPASY